MTLGMPEPSPPPVRRRSGQAALALALLPGMALAIPAVFFVPLIMRPLWPEPMAVPYTFWRTGVFSALFAALAVGHLACAWRFGRSRMAAWLAAKPWRVGAAFSLDAVLALLLLVDGLAGIPFAGFQKLPEVLRPDSVMLFRQHPNSSFNFAGYPQGTNSLGLRGSEFAPQPPQGKRRILFMGDSVVYGMGVAPDSTIPASLEQLLGPDEYEVLNAGVIGYHAMQYAQQMRELPALLNPDEIVLGITLNDVSLVVADQLDGDPLDPATRPLPPTWPNRVRWFLRFHSGLLNLHKLKQPDYFMRTGEELLAFDNSRVKNLLRPSDVRRYHVATFLRYMVGVELLAREAGVPIRAVIFPYRFQLEPEPVDDYGSLNRELAEEMTALGIPTIDLTEGMRAAVRDLGGDPGAVLLDFNHYSGAGCQALARLIASELFPKGDGAEPPQ